VKYCEYLAQLGDVIGWTPLVEPVSYSASSPLCRKLRIIAIAYRITIHDVNRNHHIRNAFVWDRGNSFLLNRQRIVVSLIRDV
ncbi:MAG: hypothetical protein FWG25_07480, partial [Promicromonosporaceae bacterium]|nr:hypothetical protein [Promicromonosporaceae bacterium]